jgi:hypothetical protein
VKEKKKAAISNEILFGLINALIPEQPDGQFIRPSALADGAAWFNPQPDPPAVWLQPDPRRTKAVCRSIISTAVLAMSSAANEKEGLRSARGVLEAFVDDFSGKGSRSRLLLPPPWPRFDKKPNALDVIIGAAQLHSAAQAFKDHPLSRDLANGADRLLGAALDKLRR